MPFVAHVKRLGQQGADIQSVTLAERVVALAHGMLHDLAPAEGAVRTRSDESDGGPPRARRPPDVDGCLDPLRVVLAHRHTP